MKSRPVSGRSMGFTIIELLVVVIIIGILAAAGMAKYQGIAESARQKNCVANLSIILRACSVWSAQNQPNSESNATRCLFGKTGRATKIPIASDAPVNWTVSDPMAIHKMLRSGNVWICPRLVLESGGTYEEAIADTNLRLCGSIVLPGSIVPGNQYIFVNVPPNCTVGSSWENTAYSFSGEGLTGASLVLCPTYGLYSGCSHIAPGFKHAIVFK